LLQPIVKAAVARKAKSNVLCFIIGVASLAAFDRNGTLGHGLGPCYGVKPYRSLKSCFFLNRNLTHNLDLAAATGLIQFDLAGGWFADTFERGFGTEVDYGQISKTYALVIRDRAGNGFSLAGFSRFASVDAHTILHQHPPSAHSSRTFSRL
jgi:hypothetical protein